MAAREPMLDMFVFETIEMIEQLQQLIMEGEKTKEISQDMINEIFRIMHTIKGSSGMMMFDNIASLAHSIEDMFYFLRENKVQKLDFTSLADLVLEGGDLVKDETERVDGGSEAVSNFSGYIQKVSEYLISLKHENGFDTESPTAKAVARPAPQRYYIANDKSKTETHFFCTVIHFEDKCEMENVRSFTLLHKLKDVAEILHHIPEEILEDASAVDKIREHGFKIFLKTSKSLEEMDEMLNETIFLEKMELKEFSDEIALFGELEQKDSENEVFETPVIKETQEVEKRTESEYIISKPNPVLPEMVALTDKKVGKAEAKAGHKVSFINVDVQKLDQLMDLVGELVISESMVTNNSVLKDIVQDDFLKSVRQHRKRLSDLQDVVMSIRMVSLAPTLNKMNRIVRDMSKKLDKKVELMLIGENTEVDKNIIEHIADPLMHIVRNSMDHGLEKEEERLASGKMATGKITIEAKNVGGDVLIEVRDDGKGLNRDKILIRAIENGVVEGDGEHLSDKEIYATIFTAGLSTKEQVTEFSGRGVGMDVVVKEIEKVRGTVSVDSQEGYGTEVTIKIPLTIAILEGMIVRVGESIFTIPVTSIRESIIVKNNDVFKDLDNKEMLSIRGECFSILRLHELYKIKTSVTQIEDGIVIMVEDDGRAIGVFADELIGEQQVVIKALPEYINKVKGTSGCTLLGNGCISMILDVSQLVNL